MDQLIFENCDIPKLPDIVGMFWYSAEVPAYGDGFQLHLVVVDQKDHKHMLNIRFSSVRC